MVTKNSINSEIPIEIAKGGTNAITMATATGLVKYDGTSLVTSATSLIDASDRYVNSSQPAFLAYNDTQRNNYIGDGNEHLVPCNVAVFDQTNSYNNATYIFTAPVTGNYCFYGAALISPIAGGVGISWTLQTTARNYIWGNYGGSFNPMPIRFFMLVPMTAGNTAKFSANANAGGNTVGIYGSNDPALCRTFFCGYLVC